MTTLRTHIRLTIVSATTIGFQRAVDTHTAIGVQNETATPTDIYMDVGLDAERCHPHDDRIGYRVQFEG